MTPREALQETDLLACVSPGRDETTCATATASATATCFDQRCGSHRVDLSLCLTQCDALAMVYTGWCTATGSPSDPLCPSPHADHDAACRAGCVL